MGIFSKVQRYRNAGDEVNEVNADRFGTPAKSLFTSTGIFSLHHSIEITDENENVIYQAKSKVFSFRDKTDITDSQGNSVAHIEKKVISIHQRHFIDMADGTHFELSNELFHIVKDIINIPELGWQLRGNVLGLNFELYDSNNNIVAVIGQKMLSLHDKYCVDIYRSEYEKEIVALLITLQHIICDREAASSSASSSVSSDD